MAANKKGKQVPSNADEIRAVNEPILRSFPPGMKFYPYDEELIQNYLQVKIKGEKLPPHMMMDINLYDYHPEDLKDVYPFPSESKWYFFTPRERKYPNGSRPSRSGRGGYWKAVGKDKEIKINVGEVREEEKSTENKGRIIGRRKVLVFYNGKAPKGEKTNWIMHEYSLPSGDCHQRMNRDDNVLDEWVLCKIYLKGGKKPDEEMETIDIPPPKARKASTIGNEFHSSTEFRSPTNGCSTRTNDQMSNTFFQYLMGQSSYVHPMSQIGQAQHVEPISQVPYVNPMIQTQVIKPEIHSVSDVPYVMPMSHTQTMEPGVQPVAPMSKIEVLEDEFTLTNASSMEGSSFQELEYMGDDSSFQELEYIGMDIRNDIDIDFDQLEMNILDNYLRETNVATC